MNGIIKRYLPYAIIIFAGSVVVPARNTAGKILSRGVLFYFAYNGGCHLGCLLRKTRNRLPVYSNGSDSVFVYHDIQRRLPRHKPYPAVCVSCGGNLRTVFGRPCFR